VTLENKFINPPDVIDRIKQYILDSPDIRDDKTKWIAGMGWDQTKWPGAQFPSAVSLWVTSHLFDKFLIMPTQHDLDKDPLLRGRPICLNRVDGHARWVSRRALELMGELPAEVEGGHIVRDTQGNPTGTSNISSPFINVLTDEQRCFCGQRHGSHSYP
jgi:predicted amidohydrolase YtcJ